MNNEQQDPLWQLLGKAKAPEVSPFFARNVAREVRALQSQPHGGTLLVAWIRRSWKLVSFGSLTTIVAVFVTIGSLTSPALHHHTMLATASAASQTPAQKSGDYEVISNLDTLVASENSDVWLDNTSY